MVCYHRSFLFAVGWRCAISFILLVAILFSCGHWQEKPILIKKVDQLDSSSTGREIRSVKLLPYWVPSAQFAGYYVGIEKRIFRKHGINLEILPFDPLLNAASALKDKKADFALLWLVNAMDMRDKGIDIVNIAQLSSRSALMLITKKSSGIAKIEDMKGKRAGVWVGFERMPQALFKKYNLDTYIVPIGSTNNLFLQGGVDILSASWFDEYHSILNNGVNEDELNKFFFADYGMNFLEDGIYCLGKLVRDDPQLCKDFVEAALEGWNYAFDNQEETIDIVVKYAQAQNQPVNHSHQRCMLNTYKTLYMPERSKTINTRLLKKDFEAIQKILLDNRFISKISPYDSIYKPSLKLSVGQ